MYHRYASAVWVRRGRSMRPARLREPREYGLRLGGLGACDDGDCGQARQRYPSSSLQELYASSVWDGHVGGQPLYFKEEW